jgi:capsular polysaccharide transport system permease protein
MSIYDDFLGVDHALEALLTRKEKDESISNQEAAADSNNQQSDPNSPEQPKLIPKRRQFKIRWGLVALVSVALPSGIFFLGMAAPRYETRSKFVIKSADSADNAASGFAAMFTKNYASSQQDAKYLKLFLRSPGVIKQLDKDLKLTDQFTRPEIDPISRFNGNPTREALSEYLAPKIRVETDDTSGSIELSTIAFNPGLSLEINRRLLVYSNQFIDRFNERILAQELASSKKQMETAEQDVDTASKSLQAFRVKTRTVDSDSERKLNTTYLKELKTEYSKVAVEYAVALPKYADPNDPDLTPLRDRMTSLQGLIKAEQATQLDTKGGDSARRPVIESQLATKLQLSVDIYKASVASYQKARVDASKRQKFLLYIDKPITPERQLKNWRWKAYGTVLLVAVGIYSFYVMLLTITKDRA